MPTIPRGGGQYTHTWGPSDDEHTQKLVISGQTAYNCSEEALFLFVGHLARETANQLSLQYGVPVPILSRHLDRGLVTHHHARYTFTIIYGLPGNLAALHAHKSDSDEGPYGNSPSSETKNFHIAQSAKLFPTHCKMPSISPQDAIRVATQELVDSLKNPTINGPLNLHHTHRKALTDITNIITNKAPPQRVGAHQPPQRVATKLLPQRVHAHVTPSNNTTEPTNTRSTPRTHQKHTRNNIPLPAIMEEIDDSHTMDEDARTDIAIAPPIHMPHHQQPTPTNVHITQEDEPPPRRSACLNPNEFRSPKGPAFISQEAMYKVLGLAINKLTPYYTPRKLQHEQLIFSPDIELDEICMGVQHPIMKQTINKYQQLIAEPLLKDTWTKAMCKELGRLAQGYGNTKGTNTIKFLTLDEIKTTPKDRTVTYARICVNYRPQKEDPNQVRITVGGNLINYSGELTTRTADLTTTKIMLNSVLSTPNAKYVTADVKNFYLKTPLDRHEYMHMPIKLIPEEIIQQYKLREKCVNGMVYMQIQKDMYGLPQAGILTNKLLKK